MHAYDPSAVSILNPSGQINIPARAGGVAVTPILQTTQVLGVGQGNVTTAAVLLSSLGTIPAGAKIATIYSDGAQLRFRPDDVNPTTAIGALIPNPGSVVLDGDLSKVRLIAAAGTAQVFVIYQ